MHVKFLQAMHGDCTIVSFSGKNILIDSGPQACYYDANVNVYGDLWGEIKSIRERMEKIDLLIVTHIDNDHIGGLLKWLEMDPGTGQLISSVWFNSGRVLAQHFGEAINKDLRFFVQQFTSRFTGVAQAIELEDYLIDKGIWDRNVWVSGAIFKGPDFNIRVVSPGFPELRRLVRAYESKKNQRAYTASKRSDWSFNLETLFTEESMQGLTFEEDKSVPNGSSLAFILTVEEKNILFLGDAYPRVVLHGLAGLGYDKNNPLHVDLVKLSHHGSNNNTSTELLEALRTENYIITTNSDYHNHPGKRTLARVLTHNQDANLFFNYEWVNEHVFTKKDRLDYKINSFVKRDFIL